MRERGDTTRILVATCDTIAVTSYYTNKATTIAVYIYIYIPCGRHTNEAPSCCCCCTFVAACCGCCWSAVPPALLGELSSLPLQLLGDRGRLRDESLVLCVPSLLELSGWCTVVVEGDTSADSGWLLVTVAPSSSLLTSSSEEKLCLRILFGLDITQRPTEPN